MTIRIAAVLVLTAAIASGGAFAHRESQDSDDRAIRRVVEEAYVSGVFVARDPAAVRRGFHPDFVLSVHDDGKPIVAPLDMWLERLNLDGVRSTDAVKHEFDRVDITGRTAVVKLEMHINGRHVYTDYMGLYRFQDGWKIVNKVYED